MPDQKRFFALADSIASNNNQEKAAKTPILFIQITLAVRVLVTIWQAFNFSVQSVINSTEFFKDLSVWKQSKARTVLTTEK